LRLRPVEALFIGVPMVAAGLMLFSAFDQATESGNRLQGRVLGCEGRKTAWHSCVISIDGNGQIRADSLFARPGDLVSVSRMVTKLSRTTFYVIAPLDSERLSEQSRAASSVDENR
jgi:hypothetical protein